MTVAQGKLVGGAQAQGPLVWLSEPVSFWGGVDFATGTICDVHHPQHGKALSGAIVCMPSGRGSSSSSSAIAELARAGKLPAAFVLEYADPILIIGVIVAAQLYGGAIPILLADISSIKNCCGMPATITAIGSNDGVITISGALAAPATRTLLYD